MEPYLFVLGRDHKLSLLEIVAYLKNRNIKYRLREYSKNIAVISLPPFNMKKMIIELGGCIKIAKVIDASKLVFRSNKVRYGISNYGGNKTLENKLKELFKKQKVKGILKKAARKKQLMPSESIKLMKKGMEFVLYKDYIGIIVAIFDPEGHRTRDKRPKYDVKKVISIRLAKILINLSRTKNGKLLDPFCGYGTILQEALLMNLRVVGVDIDREVLKDCEVNLKWLKKKYKVPQKYKLIRGDSTKLTFLVKDVAGVATEPYLGPFWKRIPDKEKAMEVMAGLEELYFEFLKNLKQTLTKDAKIALIVPSIRSRGGVVRMNFNKIIKDSGYKIDNFFSKIPFPVVYADEKDKIEREIYVLHQ